MSELDLLATVSSGMQAQRAALDVYARNIAAAEAAGKDGSYPRLVPQFATVVADTADDGGGGAEQVVFSGTRSDRGHDVDPLVEMIDVLNATRAYEANASVFDLGKQLMERTIDMGRL